MTTIHVFTLQLTNIDVEDRWLSKNTMQHWWHSVAPNTSRSKKTISVSYIFHIYIYTYNHTHIYISYIYKIYIYIYISHTHTYIYISSIYSKLPGPGVAPRRTAAGRRRRRRTTAAAGRPATTTPGRAPRGAWRTAGPPGRWLVGKLIFNWKYGEIMRTR